MSQYYTDTNVANTNTDNIDSSNSLNIQSNESRLHYTFRLMSLVEDGTITYQDLFQLLFNSTLSDNEARKRYYGLRQLKESMEPIEPIGIDETDESIENSIEEFIKPHNPKNYFEGIPFVAVGNGEPTPDFLKNLKSNLNNNSVNVKLMEETPTVPTPPVNPETFILDKIKIEQIKLRDQRRLLNADYYRLARISYIEDYIKETIPQLPFKKYKTDKVITLNNKEEAVLMLSDFHSETTVNSQFNQFNPDVFLYRFWSIIKRTVAKGRLHNVKKINVVNLGDLIGGIIHVTTRIASNEDVITQTLYLAELMSKAIQELNVWFTDINYYSTTDNHSRVTANKKDNLEKENFGRIITWYLQKQFTEVEGVKIFEYTAEGEYEIATFDVLGDISFCAIHGHNDSIATAKRNMNNLFNRNFDYIIMGHTHHFQEKDDNGTDVIVNSSLIGTEDYALSKRFNSKIGQKMLFISREGRCTYNLGFEK